MIPAHLQQVRLVQFIPCLLHSDSRPLPPSSLSTSTSAWGGLQNYQDFSCATCRLSGTERGHHPRASFGLNMPHFREHYKVLSFQSSRQDTGYKCLWVQILQGSRGSQQPIHFLSLSSFKSLQAPSSNTERYFLLPADSLLQDLTLHCTPGLLRSGSLEFTNHFFFFPNKACFF